MEKINVTINGREYAVDKGMTVLEAARVAHIDIPTLCYLKDINQIGACRICLVEVSENQRPYRMVASCVYPVTEGMAIRTNSPAVFNARKTNLELVLSNHEKHCLSCVRSTTCELQKLCNEYGVDEHRFSGVVNHYEIDDKSPIIRDNNKCILCRRCVAACSVMQGIGVIGANNRGFDTEIGTAFEVKLADTSCVNCGQCIVACPVGAIYEKDDTARVFEALADPEMHVAICTAPSVRAQIGECFGYEPGTDTELPIGERGELCISGPAIMKGYYGKPAETAALLRHHSDGRVWAHTGDVGYMDEDGFVFLDSRIKRLIIRHDGFKVFPSMIENVVSQHPAVHQCSVVGCADKDHVQGRLPFVYVVLKPDTTAKKKQVVRELERMCAEELPEYVQPVAYKFIPEMPMTPVGKIDYRQLEADISPRDY